MGAPNSISLGLDTSKDRQELQALYQELERVEAKAHSAGAAFRSGTGSAADVRNAISNVSGAQSAVAAAQGTATRGPSAPPVTALPTPSFPPLSRGQQAMLAEIPHGLPLDYYQQYAKDLNIDIRQMPQAQAIMNPGARAAVAQTAAPVPQPAPGQTAAQVDVTREFTRTLMLPQTQQVQRTAMGGVLPPGYQSSGPYTAQQLGMGGGPTMAMPAAMDPNRTMAFDVQGMNAAMQRAATAQAQAVQQRNMALGGAAVYGVASGLNVLANENVTGRIDVMGRGSTVGGLIGGLAGAFLGPLGAIGGTAIGNALGGWATSGIEKQYQLSSAIMPIQGLVGDGGARSLLARDNWAISSAGNINRANLSTYWRGVTPQSLAQGAANIGLSLFTGGIDPSQVVGTYSPPAPAIPTFPGNPRTLAEAALGPPAQAAGFTRNDVAQAKFLSDMAGVKDPAARDFMMRNFDFGVQARQFGEDYRRFRGGPQGEEVMQAISRRMHVYYRDDAAATQAINRIGPIYANEPEHGRNIADVLTRFGSIGAFDYWRSQIEPDALPKSVMDRTRDQFRDISAIHRGGGRMLEFAQTLPYGAGRAAVGGFNQQMTALALLPGGTDSLAFAQARANRREAMTSQYGEDMEIASLQPRNRGMGMLAESTRRVASLETQGLNYTADYYRAKRDERDARREAFENASDIGYRSAASDLGAARAIAASSPFAPGNRFGLALQTVALGRSRMGEINAYVRDRAARGELSEREQLEMRGEYNSLRVQQAQEIGALSEGVENRLPALTAGMPSGLRRFDSMQMAAINVAGRAPWVRAYGAMGGAQARFQRDFVSGMVGPGMDHPMSSTGPLNPATGGAGSGGADNGQVVGLLQQILQTLQRGAGSFDKKDFGPGGLPPSGGWPQSGGNAPVN